MREHVWISSPLSLLNASVLAEDFGFQHLLWVYSGRRGIHCWISDTSALNLTDDQRRGVVGFLEVIKGGASQHKKVDLPRPLHPSLRSVLDNIASPFSQIILEDQDCFRSERGWEALLRLLPQNEEKLVIMSQNLENRWRNLGAETSSKQKWAELVEETRLTVNGETNVKKVRLHVIEYSPAD